LRQNRLFVEAGYYDRNLLHRRVAVLTSKLVVVFWLHLAAILEFMIRPGLETISDIARRGLFLMPEFVEGPGIFMTFPLAIYFDRHDKPEGRLMKGEMLKAAS
jgi:hypothetical protein